MNLSKEQPMSYKIPTCRSGSNLSTICLRMINGRARFSPVPWMFARRIAASWRQQEPIRPVSSHAFQVVSFRVSLAALCASVQGSGWGVIVCLSRPHSRDEEYSVETTDLMRYLVKFLLTNNMLLHQIKIIMFDKDIRSDQGAIISTSRFLMSMLEVAIKRYNYSTIHWRKLMRAGPHARSKTGRTGGWS